MLVRCRQILPILILVCTANSCSDHSAPASSSDVATQSQKPTEPSVGAAVQVGGWAQLLDGCPTVTETPGAISLRGDCEHTVGSDIVLADGTMIITRGAKLDLTIHGSLKIRGVATITSFPPGASNHGDGPDGINAAPISIKVVGSASGALHVLNRGEDGEAGRDGAPGGVGAPGGPGVHAADHIFACAHGAGDGGHGGPGSSGEDGKPGGAAGNGGDITIRVSGDASGFSVVADAPPGKPGAGGSGGSGGAGGPGGPGGGGSTYCREGHAGPPGPNGDRGHEGLSGSPGKPGHIDLSPAEIRTPVGQAG